MAIQNTREESYDALVEELGYAQRRARETQTPTQLRSKLVEELDEQFFQARRYQFEVATGELDDEVIPPEGVVPYETCVMICLCIPRACCGTLISGEMREPDDDARAERRKAMSWAFDRWGRPFKNYRTAEDIAHERAMRRGPAPPTIPTVWAEVQLPEAEAVVVRQ